MMLFSEQLTVYQILLACVPEWNLRFEEGAGGLPSKPQFPIHGGDQLGESDEYQSLGHQ